MMADWMTILNMSVEILPRRIAVLLTGVASISTRNPDRKSSTIDVPDWNALENPFCRTIPATAKVV